MRLEIRTGVNSGEVVAGDPSSGQSFVSGDAVNVAARLEQAAQPGEILIGRGTLSLIRDAARVEATEPLPLKGKAELVPAFRLLDVLAGAPARARRLGDVSPWVGGVVLPRSPLELIAAQASPVPMLLVSNREEAVFFLAPDVLPGDPYPLSAWVRDTNAVVGPLNGAKARSLYPLAEFDSAFWSTVGLFTDAVYTCPMRRLALASSGPVYRYLFTHRYENDPLAASFRAAHFFDDPLLWHDTSLLEGFLGLPGYKFTPQEEAPAVRMAAYWTNFAKTGNPNGPGLPLWRRYTSSTERINLLDEPAGEVTGYRVPQCTFLDPLHVLFGPADEYAPPPMIR